MITHLSKEENKNIRRQLLTDIIYVLTHETLNKMRPDHTTLTPVELYLSAQEVVSILQKDGIEEGLDDEITDLQEECSSEDEAMIILVIACLMLQAINKNHPTESTRKIILHIFNCFSHNPLFMSLLNQFAEKETNRYAEGKITQLIDYELKQIQSNNEQKQVILFVLQGFIDNLDKMPPETIKENIVLFAKFNLDNNHIIDDELNLLYDKLGYKSQNITQIKEFVHTKLVQNQIDNVESGATGAINNPAK